MEVIALHRQAQCEGLGDLGHLRNLRRTRVHRVPGRNRSSEARVCAVIYTVARRASGGGGVRPPVRSPEVGGELTIP